MLTLYSGTRCWQCSSSSSSSRCVVVVAVMVAVLLHVQPVRLRSFFVSGLSAAAGSPCAVASPVLSRGVGAAAELLRVQRFSACAAT